MRGQKTEKPSARFFLLPPARSAQVRGQRLERTEDRKIERPVFPPFPGAKHPGQRTEA
ncbi:MAG: hypothetical protein LBD06_01115 [Candidatus Accumulibacter sp.]|nr:hypothetical protein [Accumulibacter sp.]